MSKPIARRATARPMRPSPTMPRRVPHVDAAVRLPLAAPHGSIVPGDAVRQINHQSHRVVGDTAVGRARDGRDEHPALGGCVDVNGVEADPEAHHDP
jgi:hypothetical protein